MQVIGFCSNWLLLLVLQLLLLLLLLAPGGWRASVASKRLENIIKRPLELRNLMSALKTFAAQYKASFRTTDVATGGDHVAQMRSSPSMQGRGNCVGYDKETLRGMSAVRTELHPLSRLAVSPSLCCCLRDEAVNDNTVQYVRRLVMAKRSSQA